MRRDLPIQDHLWNALIFTSDCFVAFRFTDEVVPPGFTLVFNFNSHSFIGLYIPPSINLAKRASTNDLS